MSSGDKNPQTEETPQQRSGPRPDFSKPLPRKSLPASIQETLDSEEKLWETLYDGSAQESTDSSIRYAAYASRVRTILLSAHRYVAYTSDIGESFRPVAHPYLIKGAYGVSWAYLLGDVGYEGYKAYLKNQRVLHPEAEASTEGKSAASSDKNVAPQPNNSSLAPGLTQGGIGQVTPGTVPALEDYRTVMAQRAIFQGVASMGLPAFTIHSIVKYSGKALKDVKNVKLRAYGPIGLGLAAVPALPYMFDAPVEHAVEWIFHKAFGAVGGPEAVHGRPAIGGTKEKEL